MVHPFSEGEIRRGLAKLTEAVPTVEEIRTALAEADEIIRRHEAGESAEEVVKGATLQLLGVLEYFGLDSTIVRIIQFHQQQDDLDEEK